MNDRRPSIVADLGEEEFARVLRSGIGVQIGPFAAKIITDVRFVDSTLYQLYRHYPRLTDDSVFSFHARLGKQHHLWPFPKRMVRFSVDGRAPHEDMPAAHAVPVLEWGLNLVIALRSHSFLMLHAGAMELNGQSVLFPATPGSGKTTLCAGLALSGWRLLSDEFGLVRPGTTDLTPVPRPLALKNESIAVIRHNFSNADLGPEIPGTRKGTIAHLVPPKNCVERASETAPVHWVLFPEWSPDASTTLTEISASEAFLRLAGNAFNYELLGESAFDTVAALADRAKCYHFEYSDLSNAISSLTDFFGHDAH